jgi:two-component system phosphate regulon sensor histidine kinase PhoR
MALRNSHFPWYFFWRNVRLNAVVGLLVMGGLWFTNPQTALMAFPFLLGGFFISSYMFYRNTRPLRQVLTHVARIVDEELPHEQRIDLFYQKDEWAQIEAALQDADTRLRAQLRTIQAENRKFTTLLGSISNEILAIDKQSNVLFFNPRFERTFLSGREKLQTGGKLWSVLDVAEARAHFEDVLQSQHMKKLKGFPVLVGTETRYYNLTVSPLPGDSGTMGGAVGVFADVTEAKLTEQMRVDFVANVSHEIRTPLTSVKGFTQVLKANKGQLPEEMHGFLDKILHNTERMIALFNDLLQLSVIESRDKIRLETVALNEILDHVESSIKASHKDKTPRLIRRLSVDQVTVDAKLFEQVITNLAENACKYSGSAPEVTIEASVEGQLLVVAVSDNGPGIAKEHLTRIFERFYRVDHSRDRGTGGTGLGLAIVKHVVMKHHGAIHAESDGQSGTRFVMKLPL